MSIVGTRPPLIGEVSEYELHHRAHKIPIALYNRFVFWIVCFKKRLYSKNE